MDNQEKHDESLRGLEEEYIDNLFRLAVKRERMNESEEILRKSQEPVTAEEEARLDQIWARAVAKMDEIDAQKKKEVRNKKIVSINAFLSQAVKIAACLVLIAAIGTTVAIAKNDSFRSAVFRLFVTENTEDNTLNIHFGKDPTAAFDVPDGWKGVYYPSAVPEGFVIDDSDSSLDDPDTPCVIYRAEDGKVITFFDFGEGDATISNRDGAGRIKINGYDAIIIETTNPLSVELDWRRDDRWLTLITQGMTREETIALAESIERVHPDEE